MPSAAHLSNNPALAQVDANLDLTGFADISQESISSRELAQIGAEGMEDEQRVLLATLKAAKITYET